MSIRLTYTLSAYGGRLIELERQGEQAIAELQGLRSTLPELRAAVAADAELSADDKAQALAEVDATIAELVAAIKAFAASL